MPSFQERLSKIKADRAARKASSKAFRDRSLVVLGQTELHETITLDVERRLRHMHTIGDSGSGKSVFLTHLIKQDIANQRGVLLLDPHGDDPHSVFAGIVRYVHDLGLEKSRAVHIVDPSVASHATGFNPLRPLPGYEHDVIADAMLEAVSSVWSGEDQHSKPTIRTVLRATFIALIEMGLTLCEAPLLFDPDDASGLRKRALATMQNDYAKRVLTALDKLAAERNRALFYEQVRGPLNRIDEFTTNTALMAILGQTDRNLDLVRAMDERHIILVNLAHTPLVSEANTQLLGAVLLRYLFLLASQRQRRDPFFVIIDECYKYVTQDIPLLLEEARKRGVGLTLAHQNLTQLRDAGDRVYGAVTTQTKVKAIFQMSNRVEARELIDAYLPVPTEVPVEILIKPTVVGNEIIWLNSESAGEHEDRSEGETVTDSEARMRAESSGETASEMTSEADITSETDMQAFSDAIAQLTSSSESLSQQYVPSDLSLFGGGAGSPGLITSNTTGLTAGRSNAAANQRALGNTTAKATSHAHATMQGSAYAVSRSVTEADTVGRSVGRQTNHTIGTARQSGRSQALAPIYKNLPSAVHSRDTILARMADELCAFRSGVAWIAARGEYHRIAVPYRKREPLRPPQLAQLLTTILDHSPWCSPRADVLATIAERRRALRSLSTPPEPRPDPNTFLDIDPPTSIEAEKLRDKIRPLPPPPLPRGKKPDLRIVKPDNDDDDPKPAA